jgi:hypothetical protein
MSSDKWRAILPFICACLLHHPVADVLIKGRSLHRIFPLISLLVYDSVDGHWLLSAYDAEMATRQSFLKKSELSAVTSLVTI